MKGLIGILEVWKIFSKRIPSEIGEIKPLILKWISD
jgi:hypothetical protein